jgi:hypothetical protein
MNTTKKDIRSWTADGQPNIFSLLSLFPISFFCELLGHWLGTCVHMSSGSLFLPFKEE